MFDVAVAEVIAQTGILAGGGVVRGPTVFDDAVATQEPPIRSRWR